MNEAFLKALLEFIFQFEQAMQKGIISHMSMAAYVFQGAPYLFQTFQWEGDFH